MIELPSVKHGLHHKCAYCMMRTRDSRMVPSVSAHGWIAVFNLLNLLERLNIKSAIENRNRCLESGGRFDI
jgi:hypothetical protein